MKLKKSNEAGFMLFETMLAVAILSGGIAVIYGAFSRSLKASQVSRDRFQANLLLEGKVWELEHGGKIQSEIGVDATPLPNIRWNSIKTGNTEENLDQWNVTLAWGEEEKKDELTLSAVLPQ